ncbi:MAG: hypothetical protein JWP75_153 [Frondihabitans sp.]|nr:hypothetical protein [Frondihabitans sp.]
MRGGAVAGISVAIAAVSHVAGGGATPGVLGVVIALTMAVLASIVLAGRALSLPRLSISVVISQVVFHIVFSLGANLPTPATGSQPVGMLGMVMSGGHTVGLPDLSSPRAAAALEMSSAQMWLGHAVAAVLTIIVLRYGERSFWRLVQLASARLARVVVVTDVLPAAPRVSRHRILAALADRGGLRPLDVLHSPRSHRGPPRVA